MDPLKLRNCIINNELNREYEEMAKEINVSMKFCN